MTARSFTIAVAALSLAAAQIFAPAASAKPAKAANSVHRPRPAKPAAKIEGGVDTRNAAPPGGETGVPEAQRLAIQADLVWLLGASEMGAEEINAHLTDQIKAFQRRNNGSETGILTEPERAALADAARPKQAAAGWRVIDDTTTGAQLGVPQKLVPKTAAARTGSRWSSKGGQVVIETFRLREASLPALFDQDKRWARREVGSSNLEPNSFTITGQQGLKKFVERAQSSGSEVRGVTVLYDQATEGTMAPIALAVADTFDGFADPALSLAGRKRGVDYGSAIVVTGTGDLITTAQVTNECRSITVPGHGHAARIAADEASDIALLRLYGARGLTPMPFGGETVAESKLTLLGMADPSGKDGNEGNADQAAGLPVQRSDQGLNPLPKLGYSGAAAVDAQGRFAGMVTMKPPIVAGAAAPPLATLIPADQVQAFLQGQGVTVTSGRGATAQSVLRVICVRN